MAGPHAGRAGGCIYCGNPSIDSCQFCGALVCKEHFHKSTGSCIKCLGGRQVNNGS